MYNIATAYNSRQRRFHPLTGIVYLIMVFFFASQAFPSLQAEFFLPLLIIAQLLRLIVRGFRKSLDIFTSVSFLLLYAIFAPNLQIFSNIDSTLTISIFILFSDAVAAFDKAPKLPSTISKGGRIKLYIGLFLSAAAIALTTYAIPLPPLSLMIPVGLGLYFQESLLRTGQSTWSAWLVLLLFEAGIALYLILHWGGFGRLAVTSYLLMPFALLAFYKRTFVKFWHLVIASPVLAVLAFVVRGGSRENLLSEQAAGVTDHLIYTHNLRNGTLSSDAGLLAYFEQYVLLFLNWFPRAIWPDKPVGSGYYSVDHFGERFLVGEEHNISLGFVGEQIFLLGDNYLLGLLFTLTTLIVLRRLLAMNSRKNGVCALIAFDATLLTYFWGGMASFGSRAWFVIAPILIISYFRGSRL